MQRPPNPKKRKAAPGRTALASTKYSEPEHSIQRSYGQVAHRIARIYHLQLATAAAISELAGMGVA